MLLILAVGTTYVMIAGGFDLSIGSVLVFSGVAAAQVMLRVGSTDSLGTVALGFAVALLCGAAWGVFNGLCITRLRVSALISTLGSMGAALGGAYLLSDGSDIRTVPNALIALGHGSVGGVPWLVVITALMALAGGVVLHMTRFGRHTYLVGSNPEASRRAGINVSGHLLKLYALSGLLAGFAAMLSLGRFSTTTLEGHANDPLEAITAVVLGGTALTGGRGSMIGTVVGRVHPRRAGQRLHHHGHRAVLADGRDRLRGDRRRLRRPDQARQGRAPVACTPNSLCPGACVSCHHRRAT